VLSGAVVRNSSAENRLEITGASQPETSQVGWTLSLLLSDRLSVARTQFVGGLNITACKKEEAFAMAILLPNQEFTQLASEEQITKTVQALATIRRRAHAPGVWPDQYDQ